MLPYKTAQMPLDGDSALILPIAMLLMLDGSDMMTVFALMFILL